MKFRPYIPYLFISLVYIISRLLFYRSGIRFDTGTFHTGWQFLDTYLLKNNLAESLLYLHSQPPLMNLLGGLALKISDTHYAEILWGIFLCCGLTAALLMFDTLKTVGVNTFFSACTTLLFVCSPAAILYENWLFYTHLEAVFLIVAVWGTARYFHDDEKTAYLQTALLAVASLCLMRSMFHLVFMVATTLFFLLFSLHKRKVLLASILPVSLVLGWYLKNLILFGSFSASTWFGMNFARLSYDHGTDLGKIGLWKYIEDYDPIFDFPPSDSLHEAISATRKKNGAANYNHINYIQVSKKFQEEATAIFKEKPFFYQWSIERAFRIYFEPAARYTFLESNQKHIDGLCRIYSLGQEYDSMQEKKVDKWLINVTMSAYGIILLLSTVGIIVTEKKYIRYILLLIVGICIYVTLVGTLFEISENHRFRYPTIPLVFIVFSISVSEIVKKIVDLRKQILT